jgi:hypothetical protein
MAMSSHIQVAMAAATDCGFGSNEGVMKAVNEFFEDQNREI